MGHKCTPSYLSQDWVINTPALTVLKPLLLVRVLQGVREASPKFGATRTSGYRDTKIRPIGKGLSILGYRCPAALKNFLIQNSTCSGN